MCKSPAAILHIITLFGRHIVTMMYGYCGRGPVCVLHAEAFGSFVRSDLEQIFRVRSEFSFNSILGITRSDFLLTWKPNDLRRGSELCPTHLMRCIFITGEIRSPSGYKLLNTTFGISQ